MGAGVEHGKLIRMVGTDHGLAPANVRSAFVLAPEARDAALPLVRAKLGATGVVLLSTCNRTELWASFDGVEAPGPSLNGHGAPQADDPLLAALCDIHNVEAGEYARYCACRAGDDAVDHLFHVACGLRSAIVAEDQIISQVKGAIAVSRELGVADSCLEVLFRQAVTAAKQVKSGVHFTRAYATAVDQAIALLEEGGRDLAGLSCMVIGNGEYGRLAAAALAGKGADVVVTVRQYTHGQVTVPEGCRGVPYGERYEHAARCDVIMSATTSPHFTLERSRFEEARSSVRAVELFDLAIPRDLDPQLAELPGCTLHGIDSFATEVGAENAQAIAAAQKLLASGEADFWDWIVRRETMAQERPPAGALFPLFIDLSDRHVVFVGGGAVALRRIRTMLPFVGEITVFAPDFSPELERFAADGAVTLVRCAWEPSVLDRADIVLACTNSAEVNDAVWEECKRRGIMVNHAGNRFKCDFHFPGVVKRDNVVVGVNAGGKDHRRVRQLRARIEKLMEEEGI